MLRTGCGFVACADMQNGPETKRLTDAIDALASVIAEIITERVRNLEAESDRRIRELPAKVVDPVLTKKELAQRLRISVRTVDAWMKRRYLPYMRTNDFLQGVNVVLTPYCRWIQAVPLPRTLTVAIFGVHCPLSP